MTAFVLGILVPIFLGYGIIRLLRWTPHPIERLAASFAAGIALLTFLFFGMAVCGIRLEPVRMWVVVLLAGGGLHFLASIRSFTPFRLGIGGGDSHDESEPKSILTGVKSYSAASYLLLALLIALVATNGFLQTYWPVWDWDSLTLYDWRAKVAAHEGGLDAVNHLSTLTRDDVEYPPLTSLAHAWLYVHGAENPTIIYAGFFMAAVAIFYHRIRARAPRVPALAATLLMATTPLLFERASNSHSQFPHAFYLAAGGLYLLDWMDRKERATLVLGCVLTGLAGWVRPASEPFFLAIFIVLAAHCLPRKKILPLVLFVVCCAVPMGVWKLYIRSVWDYGNTAGIGLVKNLTWDPELFKEIATRLWKHPKDTVWFGWVWIPFLAALLLSPRDWIKQRRLLAMIVLIIAAWVGVFYVGANARNRGRFLMLAGTTKGSAARLLIIPVPFVAFYAGASLPARRLARLRGLRDEEETDNKD